MNAAKHAAATHITVRLTRSGDAVSLIVSDDGVGFDRSRFFPPHSHRKFVAAALPDPVGEVIREWTRPNGIHISKVRVPIGVVGMIYESRPNVTSDAAALCLKTGNAVILRGGSEAIHSNSAIAEATSSCRAAARL